MKRTRVKARGPVKDRWAAWREQERAAVMERAQSVCEHCTFPKVALEWAHGFGRRQIVGEPLASSRFMTFAFCPICHPLFDSNQAPGRRDVLRWRAIGRLTAYLQDQGVEIGVISSEEFDPLGAARHLEAVAKEHLSRIT